MRTTVTLDADVAARLKAIARQRGISFKEALNSAVRAGLGRERRAARAFKQYAQPMGLRAGFNLDKALQLAAAFEDEEIVRRLERRK
ncbi:MAG: ribbon-helix-helix protein, CopG family [Candidatus Rokubacteria bacterium]|nr:ribbon-helix-helix protein, CopG family [Candidatus Rokubacteria bacterium]